MTSPGLTLQNIIEIGKRAVFLDQEGKHEGAAYFYEQASEALEKLLTSSSSVPASLASKAVEYRQRAVTLRTNCKLTYLLKYYFFSNH